MHVCSDHLFIVVVRAGNQQGGPTGPRILFGSFACMFVQMDMLVGAVHAGCRQDQMDTQTMSQAPVVVDDDGSLQTKPKNSNAIGRLPRLGAPQCLGDVLVKLELAACNVVPSAQHKKQFKAAKDAAQKGQLQ